MAHILLYHRTMHSKDRTKIWHESWLIWVHDFIGSPRFFQLPEENKRQLFIEIGNVDENGTTVRPVVAWLKTCNHESLAMSEAVFSLGKMGLAAKEAVPVLVNLLRRACLPPLLFNTVWALQHIGDIPREAAAELIKKLDERYQLQEMRGSNVRFEAARMLLQMGLSIVPDLIGALDDPGAAMFVRKILLQMDRNNLQGLLLRLLVNDGNQPDHRNLLIGLLEEIGQKHIYSILTGTIRDRFESWKRQTDAVRLLGKLKPTGKRVVPFFLDIIRDESRIPEVREAAVEALKAIGASVTEVIPVLTSYLDDPILKFSVSEFFEHHLANCHAAA